MTLRQNKVNTKETNKKMSKSDGKTYQSIRQAMRKPVCDPTAAHPSPPTEKKQKYTGFGAGAGKPLQTLESRAAQYIVIHAIVPS